jgi:hypothetical protein
MNGDGGSPQAVRQQAEAAVRPSSCKSGVAQCNFGVDNWVIYDIVTCWLGYADLLLADIAFCERQAEAWNSQNEGISKYIVENKG